MIVVQVDGKTMTMTMTMRWITNKRNKTTMVMGRALLGLRSEFVIQFFSVWSEATDDVVREAERREGGGERRRRSRCWS